MGGMKQKSSSFPFYGGNLSFEGETNGFVNLGGRKCNILVERTAARLVRRIPRFGRVSGYMRDVLHWLPYPQRIVYRISALVRRCMEGLAPFYLRELCCSTVTIQRRISLRSS